MIYYRKYKKTLNHLNKLEDDFQQLWKTHESLLKNNKMLIQTNNELAEQIRNLNKKKNVKSSSKNRI